MVDGLVEAEADGRAGGDAVGRGLGCVWLRAGVAADVVAGDVGDGAVVVGIQAHVLVFAGGGAVGDELRPAVVGEGGVRSVSKLNAAKWKCMVTDSDGMILEVSKLRLDVVFELREEVNHHVLAAVL